MPRYDATRAGELFCTEAGGAGGGPPASDCQVKISLRRGVAYQLRGLPGRPAVPSLLRPKPIDFAISRPVKAHDD